MSAINQKKGSENDQIVCGSIITVDPRRPRNERCAEALLAAIVAAPDAAVADAELIDHCRGRIGGYTIPRRFVFPAELPRSAMGKILKTEVRQRYAGASAAEAPVN